jgi:acetyltransferase-like isoleucine patch superfamily enzyme
LRLRNMRRDMIPSNIRTVILKLRLGKRIEVGFDTRIGPSCKLIVMKDAKLRLRGANLTRDIQLEVARNALLEIGRSYVGPGTIISAREQVSIGDGSLIADYVTIRDQNHVQTPEVPLSEWCFTSAPVHIGDDVWIAAKVTVVAGITIANHAMCAAGAVVTRDVESWQKVGGVPARPLKQSRHHGAEGDPRRAGESLA